MSAAGDAVLAVARGEVGYVEGPNNSTKYWDWYGANLGPWCGAFVSWCCWHAGFPACPIDSAKGVVLVSNATWHSYNTPPEALPTVALEPGDCVLFSWEPWEFRNGVPTCVGEWDGWIAGDHIGVVSVPPDASGWFSAVEGNTSSLSYDNGGEVRERSDRHISQVCGWWRPESYATAPGGGGGSPLPEDEEDDDVMRLVIQRGAGGVHGDGTAWAISPTGPYAWPIGSSYTVSVMQAHGVLMTEAQMQAKGYVYETDGGSIEAAYIVQPIIEASPDSGR